MSLLSKHASHFKFQMIHICWCPLFFTCALFISEIGDHRIEVKELFMCLKS